MCMAGGADKIVVREIELPFKRFKMDDRLVAILLRVLAKLLRLLPYLLPMLVSAGVEKNFPAAHPMPARASVCLNCLKRKADVRIGVHVGQGRGDVNPFLHLPAILSAKTCFFFSQSKRSSIKTAATGTAIKMPRKPASLAPIIIEIITMSAGTPTIFLTTSG